MRATHVLHEPVFGTDDRLRRSIGNALIRFINANAELQGKDDALIVAVISIHIIDPLWEILKHSSMDPELFGKLIGKLSEQVARGEHLMAVA